MLQQGGAEADLMFEEERRERIRSALREYYGCPDDKSVFWRYKGTDVDFLCGPKLREAEGYINNLLRLTTEPLDVNEIEGVL